MAPRQKNLITVYRNIERDHSLTNSDIRCSESYDERMAVHLVRHARAGAHLGPDEPDDLRPLTDKGEQQARSLVDQLTGFPVTRVLSSPYLRCRQTVEPLAQKLGLAIEEHAALLETADLEELWALLEELTRNQKDVVVCTHGNLIGPVIDRMHRRGVPLETSKRDCKKGSTWTIKTDNDGDFISASYMPPVIFAD